jgi:hypothetical protein
MQAGPLAVTLGTTVVGELSPRRFTTGSYGYGLHGKVAVPLLKGGTALMQASMPLVVIDSRGPNEKS